MKNASLLVDKNSDAWGFSKKIQEYIQREYNEKISIQELNIGKFRNDESNISVPENLRGKDIYYIADSSKNPNDWWAEILLIKDLVLNASANSLTLVLPDMCYSRQDRKDRPRVPISARAIADSISPGTKRIITMDLHAAQIQGFYPATLPVHNLYSFPEVVKHLIEKYPDFIKNLLILSPDAGGVDRAKYFLKRLEKMAPENEYDIGFMIKQRPTAGEVGTIKYVGPNYAGKNILIVDDIVDSGKTLGTNAEELKKGGANKIFCYATHGLFTEGTLDLKSKFDNIFTSNTHHNEDETINVVDMSPLFAESIYRTQMDKSISELFE